MLQVNHLDSARKTASESAGFSYKGKAFIFIDYRYGYKPLFVPILIIKEVIVYERFMSGLIDKLPNCAIIRSIMYIIFTRS